MVDDVVYNEIDAYACTWLRTLCREGYLQGRVVEADVWAVDSADIARARRFHAFAGIGMWEYALKLAHWPDELSVWTGSCPCQPFSCAGRRGGILDERHLWPAWFTLIRECRPPIVFGEQVASPAGLAWFDAVSADLEGEGYAVGAADLCAAGVGAPHIRQRLFFVAYRQVLGRRERRALCRWGAERVQAEGRGQRSADDGGDRRMEHGDKPRLEVIGEQQARREHETAERASETRIVVSAWADAEWLLCRDGKTRPVEPGTFPLAHGHSGRVVVVRPGESGVHWYSRVNAIRCIGNAIVPQVAAVFVEAALRSIHVREEI